MVPARWNHVRRTSTEFRLTILTVLLGAAMHTQLFPTGSWRAKLVTFAFMTLTSLGYGAMRTWAKRRHCPKCGAMTFSAEPVLHARREKDYDDDTGEMPDKPHIPPSLLGE